MEKSLKTLKAQCFFLSEMHPVFTHIGTGCSFDLSVSVSQFLFKMKLWKSLMYEHLELVLVPTQETRSLS